ncbi:MAG: DUF3160 domain-containing protein [Chitinispirillaceae bacterium]|nr:DUF3160 domain-containing protein [Chitinispirillaceae bacterium]
MKTKLLIISLLLTTRLFAGLGDLNGDSATTLDDCKQLAAAVASGTALDAAVADIDGNGSISIVDAMRLHQSIGGLWVEPTGKIAPVPQLTQEERTYFAQYEELCDQYEAMTPTAFLGKFQAAPQYASALDPQKCTYFPIIDTAFKLTAEQKALLKEQGMVVLNRASSFGTGFGGHYAEIFKKDLPVFFTSDALLDPLYKLYDDALKAVETGGLIPLLSSVLSSALTRLDSYRQLYGTDAAWVQSLSDAGTYLSVAKALLDGAASVPGDSAANGLLALIAAEKLVSCNLFGNAVAIDFSQFKPRGHYECEGVTTCVLSQYFKCMMWLGRADCAFNIDSLRQLRDFALIHACMEKAGELDDLAKINQTISFFVGDVDGFSLEGLSEILSKNALPIDSIIISNNAARRLLAAIKSSGGANQLILSQALWKGPDAARPELPAIAQICGQRFILDSYLLGRTVEWYVQGRNKPLLEEVPFCLGNNAASAVVASDVTTYTVSKGDYKPYHTRLGAARVLFEKYPYWERNLYTLWLDGLRALSQPLPEAVPAIMKSRTWQDKQMNTQLASWAQLRHNTLLYAKQSYTGGIVCFYPDGYVEPYPDFYRTIGEIVKRIRSAYQAYPQAATSAPVNFDTWTMVTDSLASMAQLELEGKPLTAAHIAFLNQMLTTNTDIICGAPPFTGWYPKLFRLWDDCSMSRPCIADVHTIPPSEIAPQNMVLHAATGDASFVIIQAATGDGCGTLFVGAVSSFYQHDESPIKRLADSEWTTMLQATAKPGVPAWFGKYIR